MSNVFSFRAGIRPGKHAATDIAAALRICRESGFHDICLFINGEEANTGFVTEAQLEAWLQLGNLVREAAHGAELTFSVNPWNTLLHGDRGRVLQDGQAFTRMVGVDGVQASAVACPLCPDWRAWFTGSFAKIAQALRPYILWVEDDFRLHNHEGIEWGGCFCDLHMAEYNRRAGKPLDRDEFIAGLLAPGEPHPYRKIWLDTHRDCMNDLSALLEAAVHSVSKETRIGLMTSSPAAHAAEGRDWYGVMRGLSGKALPPVNRIHLPSYSEAWPAEYMRLFNEISLCCRAMCPPETEVLPELENYPFSRFIKSAAFTKFMFESAAPLRLSGMMLDLFDICGGGLMPDEGYAGAMREAGGFIARCNTTGAFDSPAKGIHVLVSTQSSYTLHTQKGQSMEALYPAETFWTGLLGTFGFPIAYAVDSLPGGGICALSGQVLRNYSAAEIEGLFASSRVLLTGDAAETLVELGLGHLAGIEAIQRHAQDTGVACYEEVGDGSVYFGIEEARCSCQLMTGDYYRPTFAAGANVHCYTDVRNFHGRVTGVGIARINGNVLLYPYGNFGALTRKHFHPLRQAVLQKALAAMGADLFIENGRNVFAYAYAVDKVEGISCEIPLWRDICELAPQAETALFLVNAGMDACSQITLHTGGRTIRLIQAICSRQEEERTIAFSGNRLEVNLAPLECALLRIIFSE